MPSRFQRKSRLHVLTLDAVLAEDVAARLGDDPRTQGVEVVTPPGPEVSVPDIEALAKQTVHSRVLLLDVRSLTLSRLMHAYNRTIGYNRRDLNKTCYTLCIGDGSPGLFSTKQSFDVMVDLLARFRTDYHPAAFFFDPLMHYPHEERIGFQREGQTALPEVVPARLAKWFREDDPAVVDVRRYFRAHGTTLAQRPEAKAHRTEKLRRLLRQRLKEMAPGQEEALEPILTRQGLQLPGETLAINVYPLFFEDWIVELMTRR